MFFHPKFCLWCKGSKINRNEHIGMFFPYISSIVSIMVGRCKSTFHHFLNDVLDKVTKEVQQEGKEAKPMQLPHCTWDKFGDIPANSGARCIGLFDELVSFFSTMNMYSATKLQVSDTKEYQDFLQMYTGKAKTRETGELLIVVLASLFIMQLSVIFFHTLKLFVGLVTSIYVPKK